MRIIRTLMVGGAAQDEEVIESDIGYEPGMSLIVTSRGLFFDVYLKKGNLPAYICTFEVQEMKHILRYNTFTRSTAALLVSLQPGASAQGAAEFFLEGGVSHADIKCMKYENGMPIMKEGKLFMTMSVRLAAGGFQMVCSWNPSTAELKMEGALFFDLGDGAWCSDVASSVIYDRNSARWMIWMCSFSHGHVLARGISHEDPRFGVQVIDVRPMERAANASLTDFVGVEGDEDPDLLYCNGKWHLAICRVEPQTGYHYYHFISDDPLDGFFFADRTPTGEKTGGLFVKTEDGYCFVCGSDFGSRARYDVYPLDDFSTHERLQCDYDDGGFRGWGSVMLLPVGGRRRYVWITFDRHNASSYNWSYGNLYVFDSDYIKREP